MCEAYCVIRITPKAKNTEKTTPMLASFFTLLFLVGPTSGWGRMRLEAAGAPARLIEAFEAASPLSHFVSISRGVIDLGDVVFYVVFCGFFLHLNALVLRAQRERG